MNGLVSIIIPVYNLEEYIQFNIDNMLSQTYENIEVIYVDDGSSDSSAQIIKAAAAKDSRIKYYYKENGGVSSARNLGLEKAAGEYIMFVDGDDFLATNAVETLYSLLAEQSQSVCASNLKLINKPEDAQKITCRSSGKTADVSLILNEEYSALCYSSCAKLIKRFLIDDLRFPLDLKVGEDTFFMSCVLNRVDKIALTDDSVYFYLQRGNSATHGEQVALMNTIVFSMDTILDRNNFSNPYVYACIIERLYKFIGYYRLSENDDIKQCRTDRKKIITIGKKHMKELLHCKELGIKRFVYCMFFYCLPLHRLYRFIIAAKNK